MGRPPKRSGQRLGHRTKAEQARTVTVTVQAGEVEVPAPSGEWHEIARDWYLGLGRSAQSRFMEPSDWAAARLVAEVMTRNLASDRLNGQLFSGVWSAMNDLLTTESSRRKVHLEVERGDPNAEPAEVAKLDDYRDLYA